MKQLTSPNSNLTPEELNLDMTTEQIMELVQETREVVSMELWELVDYVFPEE